MYADISCHFVIFIFCGQEGIDLANLGGSAYLPRLRGIIGLAQLALKSTPIEKFLYLSGLRKNSVHLFYRLVGDHLKVCHSV